MLVSDFAVLHEQVETSITLARCLSLRQVETSIALLNDFDMLREQVETSGALQLWLSFT